MQPGHVDDERRRPGAKTHQVGVAPDARSAPSDAARPAAAGAVAIQRTTSTRRVPRCARLGPHRRQAELQRGDAAPGRAEVADVRALELGRARRVVGDDAGRCRPSPSAGPQRVAVVGLADRRAALELRWRRRAISSASKRQVVRAGLDGDVDARRACADAIIGSASALDRCRTCTRPPVRRASSITCGDGDVLGAARPGGQEVGVARAVRRRRALDARARPRRARSSARRARRSRASPPRARRRSSVRELVDAGVAAGST